MNIVSYAQSKKNDVEYISNTVENLTIHRASGSGCGFVDYPILSFENWSSRVINNTYSHLIKYRGDICGLSVAYEKNVLINECFNDDQIICEMRKAKGNFILWDLLAIEPNHQGKGIAKKYSQLFLTSLQNKFNACYGTVCHKPHKNTKQISLLTSLGFELEREINVYNGLIFGVYKLGLKNLTF